jgi:cyclase
MLIESKHPGRHAPFRAPPLLSLGREQATAQVPDGGLCRLSSNSDQVATRDLSYRSLRVRPHQCQRACDASWHQCARGLLNSDLQQLESVNTPLGLMLRRTCATLFLAASIVRGQVTADKLPSILTYTTVKVADGIYAFITPEERTGFQSGNSIAIIGDDGVLVFDTGNLPSVTRRQIAEIRKLTNKPVRFVVNSHWHPDHNLGNSEYKAAFPGVTIIGTSATREAILDRPPGYLKQVRDFAPTDSLMHLRLSAGTMRDGSPMPDIVRLMWGLNVRDYDEFAPEVLSAHPLAPEVVFDDSLTIMLGSRAVKVVRPGRANTAGDAYVYVPDAAVLLTGDLVTVPCPFPSTSFYSEWIAALDQLKPMHAAAIVPGHGDVQHDYAYVDLVRELLAYTREQARAAVRAGRTLEQLQKSIDFSAYIDRFARGDPIRRDAFNSFYREEGTRRAYEEAKFESQSPIGAGR